MSDKSVYINGLGLISAQKTLDNARFLDELVPSANGQLRLQEPNYKEYVAGDMVRRMSRIIKMGIASARICLQDAGVEMPDAIITGTGLGCLEDTEKFLGNLIRNNEELLTPTAFIQSTHNTVSGQIALLLKCHAYNFTYCHRGFSFETALLDALLKLHAGHATTVLAGGMDELTATAFRITERMGHWKRNPESVADLYKDQTRGTIAGEGSGFFLLSNERTERSMAKLLDVETIYRPEGSGAILQRIEHLLSGNALTLDQVSLYILGMNGDPSLDAPYHELIGRLPAGAQVAVFKHLSGEFHTSGVFALWLASMIHRHGFIPDSVRFSGEDRKPVGPILICNSYRDIEHAIILTDKA